MARLETPELPLRLYRYRSFVRGADALAQEIDAVKSGYIYCSTFDRMNDPMEGYFRPTSGFKGHTDYKKTLQRIVGVKTNIGVACFSETKDDLLMWTHYAGNHSGVCIAYSTKRLLDGLSENVSLVRLGYGDAPPLVSANEALNAERAARKILSQKKLNWAYEREWRVLGPVGQVPINGQAVAEIYFGSRVSLANRQKFLSKLQRTNIKALTMEVNEYAHRWEPVNAAAKKRGE
jgi:hypothetical protein